MTVDTGKRQETQERQGETGGDRRYKRDRGTQEGAGETGYT